MTENYNADQIARDLGRISPLVDYARALPGNVDSAQEFGFVTNRTVTTDEMVSICRDMATVMRREMPERADGWAALIHAKQYGASSMGIYFIGWSGRSGEWRLHEGQERKAVDHADWLALRERLRTALTAFGTEADRTRGEGDFFVMNEESSRHRHVVFFHSPEFLTKELINTIQNVLRDGNADWVVAVKPAFPPPLDVLFRGVEVRTEGIEEKWDRREAEELLGDRLKI
jgi:hypothetical protein